jgi:hypothetical protein
MMIKLLTIHTIVAILVLTFIPATQAGPATFTICSKTAVYSYNITSSTIEPSILNKGDHDTINIIGNITQDFNFSQIILNTTMSAKSVQNTTTIYQDSVKGSTIGYNLKFAIDIPTWYASGSYVTKISLMGYKWDSTT